MSRTKIFAILIGALLAALPVRGQENVEQIVAQKVQPILPANGKGGGVAVAVRMSGETRFFNYGFANDARNERVTADSIFNLGSVGDNDARGSREARRTQPRRPGCQICHRVTAWR